MAFRNRGIARVLRSLALQNDLSLVFSAHPGLQAFKLWSSPSINAHEPATINRFTSLRHLNNSSEGAHHAEASTTTPPMPEGEFHKLADHTLEDLVDRIEVYVDELDLGGGGGGEEGDDDEVDVEYSQGVLTIRLGGLGTYVLNKQTPNRQIWMSSPVSGPVRYDHQKGGTWVYRRDGHKLHLRLEKEFEEMTGVAIDLNPCSTCEKLNACVENAYCQKSE